MSKQDLTGIELMRDVVRYFGHCNETFNQQFTPEQLIKLYKIACKCNWDFPADEWTDEQVKAALDNDEVPTWFYDGETDRYVPIAP